MREKLEMRKKIVSQWFGFLQSQIYEEFENLGHLSFMVGKDMSYLNSMIDVMN